MPYRDPAKNAACKKAYIAKNRQKHLAACKRWKQRNPEKCVAHARNWQKKNPDRAREICAVRTERRRAAQYREGVHSLTLAQWRAIKAHYKYCCVYCGKKQTRLTQDHITPLSKGGSHHYSNIVPACSSCNAKKGARAPLISVQPLLLI